MSNHNHLNYCTRECKYHVVFAAKISKETLIWYDQKRTQRCFSWISATKGMQDRGGILDVRSCAYVDINSSQTFCIKYCWIFEREEFNLGSAEHIEKTKEFCGP